MCQGKAVVGIVAAVLLLSGSVVAWSAATIWNNDPNSVQAALAQADGSTVTITCAEVLWRGKSGQSFAIKAWSEPSPQRPELIAISNAALSVQPYWSVCMIGVLQTLPVVEPNGAVLQQRVIVVSPQDIMVLCGPSGKPYSLPVFSEMLGSWFTKQPLTLFCDESLLSSNQLPTLPDTPDAPPPTPGSRDSIRSLPDGARISVNGAVVACSTSGRFAVERADRSFAIWVASQSRIARGTLLDITGHVSTEGGSRVVVADSVSLLDEDYPEAAYLGVNNRNLNYGLDTSGMLVRVWGVVTYVDSVNRIFFADDGSNLDGGSNHVGVKVYDLTEDTLPSVDDYVAVNGDSGSESPGIRYVAKVDSGTTTYSTLSMLMGGGTGVGTITGAITAPDADGSSVRVYCGKASTTVTFVGDTARYTLRVPYGRHAVTATVAGYKTTTKLVVVNRQTPDPVQDFALPTILKVIDVVSVPNGTLADGTKEVTITSIVRDEEGRRFANSAITWEMNGGTLVSSDSATNVVGEASAVLRYGSAGACNVVVHAGALIGQRSLE